MLRGQVALVTGASRGIGRGIALQLGEAGATVYVTGRQPKSIDSNADPSSPTLEKTASEITRRGGIGIAAYCDHSNSDDVKRLFDRIEQEQEGQLDILVNNAYAGVNTLFGNIETGKQFWELDPLIWDEINNVGLRNHYICGVYAARLMVPRKRGLIVIVSSAGGLRYIFNSAYGIGKAACDRMASDFGHELRKHNITVVSLWPGAVKTETVLASLDREKFKDFYEGSESTEYSGRAVVHLAADKNQLQKTGKILITGDLGDEYGFTDIDGERMPSLRSLNRLLKRGGWNKTAWLIPSWIKVPGWVVTALNSRL